MRHSVEKALSLPYVEVLPERGRGLMMVTRGRLGAVTVRRTAGLGRFLQEKMKYFSVSIGYSLKNN